ncbi:hypothetical protein N480_05870 [Pseudoalteromonas luteoviolacea S2607]|uniref:hypothetical protein n=1 Tax=Pseudoalteromonas luteoviolacea TaxID=43657 RepID=UPI0007B052E0|nr:hypothetical protein [Pseudoalteromonas luteoviolacea]KZN30481.1 hypothetical protein N480_05870 [Pseudoalteromonas luteoviolacea S2607]
MKGKPTTSICFYIIALSFVPLVACEGNQGQQSTSEQSQAKTEAAQVNNLMFTAAKYVVGACVESGYPTLKDSQSYSQQERDACTRNQSHRYNPDTLVSDTKLNWRIKVKGREIQCTCAGYVKDLSPAK